MSVHLAGSLVIGPSGVGHHRLLHLSFLQVAWHTAVHAHVSHVDGVPLHVCSDWFVLTGVRLGPVRVGAGCVDLDELVH